MVSRDEMIGLRSEDRFLFARVLREESLFRKWGGNRRQPRTRVPR